MSKKIAKAPEAPKRKTPPEYIDEMGQLRLAGALFWKYRAVDSEFRNAQLAALQKQGELDAALQADHTIRGLIAERRAMDVVINQKSSDLQKVYGEIAEALQIELNGVSIDDLTGKVYQTNTGTKVPIVQETEAPAPKKRRKR